MSKKSFYLSYLKVLYSNLDLKNSLQNYIQEVASKLQKPLVLNIALIGSDLASVKYTNLKQIIGKKLGIEVIIHNYFSDTKTSEYRELIDQVLQDNSGLIFQLPVPKNVIEFVANTPSNSDVDLLGNQAFKLWERGFLPPTIGAIDLVLKDILHQNTGKNIADLIDLKLDLKGKTVGVIGQGVLVGKPLVKYLLDREATIISINKDTVNPKELAKNCDILICAAGVPGLVNQDWIHPNTIIIDAATSESSGVLVGDVVKDSLFQTNLLVASPSGVGSLTVLYLFYNLVKLAS